MLFFNTLLKAQDGRARGELIERLLSRSSLPAGKAEHALRLWRRLAQAPGRATDAQLDELAALLFTQATTEGTAKKGGLLEHLFERADQAMYQAKNRCILAA